MIAERVLLWLLLGAIGAGCIVVLMPFFSALLWAAILVFTTWPVFEWLHVRARLGRSAAAGVMVGLTAVVVVLPLALAAPSGGNEAAHLRTAIEQATQGGLPPAPDWVGRIPIAGTSLLDLWERWAADLSEAVAALRPYLGMLLEALLGLLLGIARGVLMFVLALFIGFFFYVYGEPMAARLRAVLLRLAGPDAERMLRLTGATVRGVVYGILGTAVLQGILTALGFWLAGVPHPWLLGAVAGFLAVFPVGAPLVWVPTAVWLLLHGHIARGIFVAAWGGIAVSGADSVIRPWFIARGARLPFLLTVLGVLGGTLAFGLLGVFLGPVLLGVGYTLVNEWAGEPLPALAVEEPASVP